MKKENQEMRKEYQDMKREYQEMRKENQKMFNQITENQILLTQKLTSSDVTRELEAENIKKQFETTKNTILNCTIFTTGSPTSNLTIPGAYFSILPIIF